MTTADLLLKGFVLGVINAAPVGPVGLLCLRKNLDPRRTAGLSAGCGMAAAYAVVAFCVVAGLKPIGHFLEAHEGIVQVVGGLLLLGLGYRGLRPPSEGPSRIPASTRCFGEFSASLALTLFNPVPFATFALILSAFPLQGPAPDIPTDLAFAISVSTGTLLFWLLLNEILHHVRKRSPEFLSRRIVMGSSIFLLLAGLFPMFRGIA